MSWAWNVCSGAFLIDDPTGGGVVHSPADSDTNADGQAERSVNGTGLMKSCLRLRCG